MSMDKETERQLIRAVALSGAEGPATGAAVGYEFAMQEIDELKARLNRALMVLRKVEWQPQENSMECACCRNKWRFNHTDDCALAAVLREIDR